MLIFNYTLLMRLTSHVRFVHKLLISTPSRIHIHNEHLWSSKLVSQLREDCRIVDNYVNELDEQQLYNEIEPRLRRLRYEETHTDDVSADCLDDPGKLYSGNLYVS